MQRCDFRSNRECHCAPGECVAQPKAIAIPRAPLITLTVGEQFFAMAMLTIFMIVISYGALSNANEAYRKQDLKNQEVSVQWTK